MHFYLHSSSKKEVCVKQWCSLSWRMALLLHRITKDPTYTPPKSQQSLVQTYESNADWFTQLNVRMWAIKWLKYETIWSHCTQNTYGTNTNLPEWHLLLGDIAIKTHLDNHTKVGTCNNIIDFKKWFKKISRYTLTEDKQLLTLTSRKSGLDTRGVGDGCNGWDGWVLGECMSLLWTTPESDSTFHTSLNFQGKLPQVWKTVSKKKSSSEISKNSACIASDYHLRGSDHKLKKLN